MVVDIKKISEILDKVPLVKDYNLITTRDGIYVEVVSDEIGGKIDITNAKDLKQTILDILVKRYESYKYEKINYKYEKIKRLKNEIDILENSKLLK